MGTDMRPCTYFLFPVSTAAGPFPFFVFLIRPDKWQMTDYLFLVGTWKGNGLVFNGKHIMPEKLLIVLFYGAKRADFTIWIIPLFVRKMYLLVHKNGHSQKWGMSEKGEYKKVLR